ncbi:hypothetical protein M0R45_000154 [Rubus argutus]|uniref:CASP-like protein n=1 Tax=Rubus argutus TaxID=59490 RepID=A0AAW1VQN1_RUBAR
MKDFPGTPGTLTGLLLRISQFVFAAGSIASMASTSSFFSFTAFCYLIASMGLQVIWSFCVGIVRCIFLDEKKALHNPVLVSLFVVGDWMAVAFAYLSWVTIATSSLIMLWLLAAG